MARKRVELRPPFALGASSSSSSSARLGINRPHGTGGGSASSSSSRPRTPLERFERQVKHLQRNRHIQRFSTLVSYALIAFLALNCIAPPVVYVWPSIMSHLIFQQHVRMPFKNLSDPSSFGLDNTYAFAIAHEANHMGAWHVLPQGNTLQSSGSVEEHFALHANHRPPAGQRKPIFVLYLHGNTNDRSTGHRVKLYALLRQLGLHVVAMDYRGYGDSTGDPTEDDVVKDALFTYDYLLRIMPEARVYIWGHSLGTGITARMAFTLTEQGRPPPGILLEAPFYNIFEEVALHPITRYVWPYNPALYYVIDIALKQLELQFRTDLHLPKVTCKIMILHSEDDSVIPFSQAEKLYNLVSKTGVSKDLTFHRFPAKLGCGHNSIHRAPELPSLIKKHFV